MIIYDCIMFIFNKKNVKCNILEEGLDYIKTFKNCNLIDFKIKIQQANPLTIINGLLATMKEMRNTPCLLNRES